MTVHQHMHNGVQKYRQIHVSVTAYEPQPHYYIDGAMVVEVQERQLAEGFSQDEEPRVEKLHELLQVEHDIEMAKEHIAGARAVVCSRFITYKRQLSAHKNMDDAKGHIARKTHHGKIVQEHGPLAIKWRRPRLHVRVQRPDRQQVERVGPGQENS